MAWLADLAAGSCRRVCLALCQDKTGQGRVDDQIDDVMRAEDAGEEARVGVLGGVLGYLPWQRRRTLQCI